jgi:hypothetical protein
MRSVVLEGMYHIKGCLGVWMYAISNHNKKSTNAQVAFHGTPPRQIPLRTRKNKRRLFFFFSFPYLPHRKHRGGDASEKNHLHSHTGRLRAFHGSFFFFAFILLFVCCCSPTHERSGRIKSSSGTNRINSSNTNNRAGVRCDFFVFLSTLAFQLT